MLFFILGCIPYKLVQYEIPSLPDTYMTSPQERSLYCEVGYAYAEGFTIEEAKQNLYQPVREGTAAAIVELEYSVRSIPPPSPFLYVDSKKEPLQVVYVASGVLITWGPCK